MLKKIRAIFWDFDGVLIDSNHVRESGFKEVLIDYPADQVEQLINFHQANGGLSRYVKFRYFFENIRREKLTENQLLYLARQFSIIMKGLLTNPDLIIKETCNFVQKFHNNFAMHIVSGSDQVELRYLCKELGIASYFKSINGSPTPKKQLVKDLLTQFCYSPRNCLLIGDSINDYEAALANRVKFMAFNNPSIDKYSDCHFEFKF